VLPLDIRDYPVLSAALPRIASVLPLDGLLYEELHQGNNAPLHPVMRSVHIDLAD
jgi:hypothetical protein